MRAHLHTGLIILFSSVLFPTAVKAQGALPGVLPEGVRAVWELDRAQRSVTPTRERVCLNGLWRWQPAGSALEKPPILGWGYFKVPGCWPGITDYMQKDCQLVFPHPSWKNDNLGAIAAAWYEREITVPREWNGRRIVISAEYVNSLATVFVDGRKAGEIRFPEGEVDLTAVCRPGGKHVLSLLAVAMPLQAVLLSHSDTFGTKEVKGSVARRGLCGDVYLVGIPSTSRIRNVSVRTSVRNWTITFDAALDGLARDAAYVLRARVTDNGKSVGTFTSRSFKEAELKNGHIAFTEKWKPEKLWDTHTPENLYSVDLSLLDGAGNVQDTSLPEPFGFREFWIDGRDFYLNGSRIWLCAVPLDNAQIGAAWASYQGARESLQRLRSFGVNCVYTHNYGCEPGAHLSFAEVLKAADDEGMLISLSQPHFSEYKWQASDAESSNGYARHAEFYVRVAGNHPSVVFYSTSHNATGTEEEMNPDLIDGIQDVRNKWSANNAKNALRAEAIVKRLDPSRIVYHHSSGNLGSMHTANFYANFAPIQEMSDWFEHWARKGAKPVFLCEYGVPIFWDWMMYRGWYKGQRTFGSAQVPWEFCLAEWDAQFFGTKAYELSELEKDCLRWEARRFRAGQLWHRWDYPRNAIESPDFEQRNAVVALYLTENLRAFRTWGLSAYCPWDHGAYWKLRDGVKRARKELKVNWDSLQQPGFSPDYVDGQMEWINTSFERADWIPTTAAEALLRNNRPLLAYIGGKASAFTGKDHNFLPGETVEKQIIVINNSRQTVKCVSRWSLALPEPIAGDVDASVETGQQARLPIRWVIPPQTKPGRYQLSLAVQFSTGERQQDTFAIDVLPYPTERRGGTKIALFDPKGETGKLLGALGIQSTSVVASTDLAAYDLLIVGKGALTPDSPAPAITRVRDGLKVIVFEQTPETLEQRFGFRIAEYGLRQVFRRVPDHPLLNGIGEECLANWRGEATLLPPRLKYEIGPRYAPQVNWCNIPVTRVWRAGNRGSVASVLIETPARGDFLPILDGGFSLQYSPLLEYREGKGLILFCQLDVTGRTEDDPAARQMARHLVQYAAAWKPARHAEVLYVGDAAGKKHLERAGVSLRAYAGEMLPANAVLIVGPGGGKQLADRVTTIADFLKAGGSVLAVGLDESEANAFLPFKVTMKRAEHIGAYFEPFGKDSLLAGVSPADIHNRDPRVIDLVSGGATIAGDGVIAVANNARVVFCQLPPYVVATSDGAAGEPYNVRKTYRRTSCLLTRLLCNLGGTSSTPLVDRFAQPVGKVSGKARWRDGLYLDEPEEWDYPYRFFCW